MKIYDVLFTFGFRVEAENSEEAIDHGFAEFMDTDLDSTDAHIEVIEIGSVIDDE